MSTHCIDNVWSNGQGSALTATDPTTGDTCWKGAAATESEVASAIAAARTTLPEWSHTTPAKRIGFVEAFADTLAQQRDEFAHAISIATGKPTWEALSEVDAMVAKAKLSVGAYSQRLAPTQMELDGTTAATHYRPIGVMAVLGPFNLPGHLPNGHIMPALLAGNTIVFKPSEQTPGVGERMMQLWQQVSLPAGVLNLVQGGRSTGEALVQGDIDGVLFTGSYATGSAIHRLLAGKPEKLLALEMGGNNPLVVYRAGDLDAAAYLTALSAFITAGQRCTCARRLILPHGEAGDRLLELLAVLTQRMRVGRFDADPPVFIGPVISADAAQRLLVAQDALLARGGRALVQMQRCGEGDAMLRPGIVDVTEVADRSDTEIFGPLLQVIRTPDFDAAIEEAGRTSFGLTAGLLCDDRECFDHFFANVRAGVVNWNRQTTGASGRLPFGGVGQSGNHRPSGYYAVDYCADPVASLMHDRVVMPAQRTPGIGSDVSPYCA